MATATGGRETWFSGEGIGNITLLLLRLEEPRRVDTESVVDVVASGERAMLVRGDDTAEIVVRRYRYTPEGLVYDIEDSRENVRRTVPAAAVRPLAGETRMMRVNLVTGDETELGERSRA
jgi:hypothetical protein